MTGAAIMKMINSTSITSIIGVTLIWGRGDMKTSSKGSNGGYGSHVSPGRPRDCEIITTRLAVAVPPSATFRPPTALNWL